MGTAAFDRLWDTDPAKPKAPVDALDALWDAPSTPAPAKPSSVSDVATDVLGSVLRGGTLGLSKVLGAGVNAVLPQSMGGTKGFDLGAGWRMEQEAEKRARQRSPVLSNIAHAAGSAIPIVATAGLSAPAADASLGARLVSAAGQGAVYGGVQGATAARDASDLVSSTTHGMATGAVFGGGLSLGGALAAKASDALGVPELVGRGATYLADRFPSARNALRGVASTMDDVSAGAGMRGRVNRFLTKTIEAGGETPQSVASRALRLADDLGAKPELAADVSRSNELQGITGVLARKPGTAGASIRSTLTNRNTTALDRIRADLLKSEPGPTLEQGTDAELRTMIRARDLEAEQRFPLAYKDTQGIDDPDIASLMQRPTVKDIWQRAQRMEADAGRAIPMKRSEVIPPASGQAAGIDPDLWATLARQHGLATIEETPLPNVRTMAAMDRAFRRMIDEGYEGKGPLQDPQHIRDVEQVMDAMRERLIEHRPEWGDAITDYAARSRDIDALKLGQNIGRYVRSDEAVAPGVIQAGDPAALRAGLGGLEGVEEQVKAMSPRQQTLFRRGAQQWLEEQFSHAQPTMEGSTTGILQKQLGGSEHGARWRSLLFGDNPEAAARFEQNLARERRMVAGSNAMTGNSATQPRQSAQQQLDQATGRTGGVQLSLNPFRTVRSITDAVRARSADAFEDALGQRLGATGADAIAAMMDEASRAAAMRAMLSTGGNALRNLIVVNR